MRAGRFLAALLFWAAILPGSEPPLTNSDVVKMVQAGLSSATVAAKIRTSTTAFATDPDSLIDLAKRGVPDDLVRIMIERQAASAGRLQKPSVVPPPTPPPSVAAASAAPRAPRRSARPPVRRRFDGISIHQEKGGRCDDALLEISSSGIRTTGCHESDVDMKWEMVESVCYHNAFRGTLVIARDGKESRLSTMTPAAMQAVRDAIRAYAPRVREVSVCR